MSFSFNPSNSVGAWIFPAFLMCVIFICCDLLQYFPAGIKYGTLNTDIVMSSQEVKSAGISYVFNDSVEIQRDIVLLEFIIWNNSGIAREIKESNPLILEVAGEGLFIDCKILKTKKIDSANVNYIFKDNRYVFSNFIMPSRSSVLFQVLAVNYDPSWTKLIDSKGELVISEIRFHNKDVTFFSTFGFFTYILLFTWLIGNMAIRNRKDFIWDNEFVYSFHTTWFWVIFLLGQMYYLNIHFFPPPIY